MTTTILTVDELKDAYEKTKVNDEIIQICEYISGYRNEPLRSELRQKYISILPKNKQLAIFLHSRLCHCNHTDQCSFYYEIDGLEDDWESYTHKKYLSKANKLLEICPDMEKLQQIAECIAE